MKRSKYVLLLLVVFILIAIGINTLIPKSKLREQVAVNKEVVRKSSLEFNISQLSLSEWNTQTGIPYSQVPGANLGATSFQIIDQNRIAFLCNSTSEVIITNKSTGKSIKKFKVSMAPRDFVYESDKFYVLSEYEVTVYDETGNELIKYPFPMAYQGVERLIRFNDATYILLPEGISLMVENCGTPIEPTKYKGIITGNGSFITSQITGNNSYLIKVSFSDKISQEKTYTTDKKIAGVFVIGTTENRVILDVQTFITENPIAVERTITSIELNKNELEAIVTTTIIPDSYYVISNKDFYVSETGIIYNMMTSPQGVYVFSLSEIKSEKAQGYPSSLTDNQYHSNDNLIKID